jgi:hypothetical protein
LSGKEQIGAGAEKPVDGKRAEGLRGGRNRTGGDLPGVTDYRITGKDALGAGKSETISEARPQISLSFYDIHAGNLS